MKRLAFECRYVLASIPCDTCAGSGKYSTALDCWDCRSLGRRITSSGREVFYAICELLGFPVLRRESRIDPKHLDMVTGGQLTVGMRIRPLKGSRMDGFLGDRWRDVASVQGNEGNVFVRFADQSMVSVVDHETFARELTADELETVEQLMAERLGHGVELASEAMA